MIIQQIKEEIQKTEIKIWGKINKFFKNRWVPPLIYAVLALGVLGALLRPGYIFSLDTIDMVFPPMPSLWAKSGD